MQPRMTGPALSVPGVLDALRALNKAASETASQSGVPRATIDLVGLRTSQINGCAVCLDMHARAARKNGETDERLFTVAGWREVPCFTDAERAALALAEAVIRISDRPEPVPDAIWDEVTQHYDERALAALLLWIATINAWNRLNVITS